MHYKYYGEHYQFGKIIKNEVYKLLSEENDKNANRKRLSEITFKTEEKNKAALYDIIGSVFYKGKYGCSPNINSNPRKECIYQYWCTSKNCPVNAREERCAYCEWSGNCSSEDKEKCVFKYKCDYKEECDLETNDWCDKIYGHNYDYWMEEDFKKTPCKKYRNFRKEDEIPISTDICRSCKGYKDTPKCIKENIFPKTLGEETFAHMAAEAIVNPDAYAEIKKCLPESERMFKEILKDMCYDQYKI